jgi:hypothetical protein
MRQLRCLIAMTLEKQKTGLSSPELAEALASPLRGIISRADVPLIYRIGIDQLAAQMGQRTVTNLLRVKVSEMVRDYWESNPAALDAALEEYKKQAA